MTEQGFGQNGGLPHVETNFLVGRVFFEFEDDGVGIFVNFDTSEEFPQASVGQAGFGVAIGIGNVKGEFDIIGGQGLAIGPFDAFAKFSLRRWWHRSSYQIQPGKE